MENQTEQPDFNEEISQKLLESATMTRAQRNKKLLKWSIRQVFTIALVAWLWDKPWIKYVLWAWLPLAIINLVAILYFNKMMAWRLKKKLQKSE